MKKIKNRVLTGVLGFILLGFILLGFSAEILASTILKVDFDVVAKQSEIVFQGKVTSSEVRLLPNGQAMTFVTFKIDELIKGEYPTPTIELGFLGGEINGQAMYISDLTMPQLNEEGVYFVESTSRRLINPLYGWHQGHYFIKTDAQGNKTVQKLQSDAEYQIIDKSSGFAVKQIVEDTPSNSLSDFKQRIKNTLTK